MARPASSSAAAGFRAIAVAVAARYRAARTRLSASGRFSRSHISAVARQPSASFVALKCRSRRSMTPGMSRPGRPALPAARSTHSSMTGTASAPAVEVDAGSWPPPTWLLQRVGVVGRRLLAFATPASSAKRSRASWCRPRARVAPGEVAHAAERVGVVEAEVSVLSRTSCSAELQGAGSCRPRAAQADGQVVHGSERVGVVGPSVSLPQRQRVLVQLQGLLVPAGVS